MVTKLCPSCPWVPGHCVCLVHLDLQYSLCIRQRDVNTQTYEVLVGTNAARVLKMCFLSLLSVIPCTLDRARHVLEGTEFFYFAKFEVTCLANLH